MTKPKLITNPAEVPTFQSEEEEATFWDRHEFGAELLDQMKPRTEGTDDALPRPRARSTPISIRFEPDLLVRVKAAADERHTPYQTLLKHLVAEGLAAMGGGNTTSQEPPAAGLGRPSIQGARLTQCAAMEAVKFPHIHDQSRARRHTDAVRQRRHVLAYSSR